MNRHFRKLAGWIGIVAVLFAQLALSAYACPMQQVTASAQSQDVDADCCADKVNTLSALCHEHCKDGKGISADPSPVPLGFVATFSVNLPPVPDVAAFSLLKLAQHIPHVPPPLSILNCCFRI